MLDPDTGQELRAEVRPVQPRKIHLPEHVRMHIETFRELSRRKDLTGEDRRVLDALFARMNYENRLIVSPTEIGKDIGIDRAHVSRALRKLVNAGILDEGERIGSTPTYTVNPAYAWKGAETLRLAALSKRAQPRGKRDSR